MRRRCFAGVWILALLCAPAVAAARAAEAPPAVSPGGASKLALVEARCPTFSWGEVEEARGYELVIYRLGKEGEELQPVLRRFFPGSVETWTPSLDLCLERGGRYAWSVRAVGETGASRWSAPSLFKVAPAPSAAELEDALRVVRSYFEQEAPNLGQEALTTLGSRSGFFAEAAEPQAEESVSHADEPTPRSHAGTGGGGIVVNGTVAETKADPPCYSSAPYPYDRMRSCGNGTVLDTVTGLLWLEQANCLFSLSPSDDGRRTWSAANDFAQILGDGLCGLSDHSQAGDWRLPTESEWATIHKLSCAEPELVGRSGGCFSYAFKAWATNVVHSSTSFYWSSTASSSSPAFARGVSLGSGSSSQGYKTDEHFLWPVRDGQ